MKLPTSGISLGVDWSGAKTAERKVWVSQIQHHPHCHTLLSVQRPFDDVLNGAFQVSEMFGYWLTRQQFTTAGQIYTILEDKEGDALDSVFAAVAAGSARVANFIGASETAAITGEGWIYD